ncbi:MAG: hypothetical protein ABI886_03060 [Betaproteobacteria bacterium]
MTSTLPPSTHRSGDLDRFGSIVRDLRTVLDGVKRALDEEIRAYPTPIPRCDAQFNHLYEHRARLTRILGRVNATLERGTAAEDLADALAEFAAAPAFSDSADEKALRARIGAALALR